MHYYKFNIADWSLHTAHLTLEEEAIYFRLLNYYYDTEKPIPQETESVIRRLRLASKADIALFILEEFFTKKDGGWFHSRCEKEIKSFKKKSRTNRANGSKGGRPRASADPARNPKKTQTVSRENPNVTLTTNHKPLTTNHKPLVKEKTSVSPSLDATEVIDHLNAVTGSKYKTTTRSHVENINARLADGNTVDDLKTVINAKHHEWGSDTKMSQYLRPSTLFQAGKFPGYLVAAKTQTQDINHVGTDFSAPPGWNQLPFDGGE